MNDVPTCPLCHKPIRYARLDDGRTIILEFEESDSGGVAVVRTQWGLRARLTAPDRPRQPYEHGYLAHAVVCRGASVPAPRRPLRSAV